MTDKDRYELKIAGLLHDCGKVTTPVHVVDKATKLQTIYDRIELVDTRFEAIKRDAEIAMLRLRRSRPARRRRQGEGSAGAGASRGLRQFDEDRFLRASTSAASDERGGAGAGAEIVAQVPLAERAARWSIS